MVAINKFIVLAVVASVLVSAAFAEEVTEQPAASVEGSLRSMGKKLVNTGSSILSHIPIVNRFFGDKKQPAGPAAVPETAPATPAEKTEEQAPAQQETAQTEAPAAAATTEADSEEATTTEAPAASQEEPAEQEESQ